MTTVTTWKAIYERLFERGPDSFSRPERETIRAAIEEAWNAGVVSRPPAPAPDDWPHCSECGVVIHCAGTGSPHSDLRGAAKDLLREIRCVPGLSSAGAIRLVEAAQRIERLLSAPAPAPDAPAPDPAPDLVALVDEALTAAQQEALNSHTGFDEWRIALKAKRAVLNHEIGLLITQRDAMEAQAADWMGRATEAEAALDRSGRALAEVCRERDAAEADKTAAWDENTILTRKIITCGVAASHPDAGLSRRGAYAGKWDSPQAEEVRQLRVRAEAAEARAGRAEKALRAHLPSIRSLCEGIAERERGIACYAAYGPGCDGECGVTARVILQRVGFLEAALSAPSRPTPAPPRTTETDR